MVGFASVFGGQNIYPAALTLLPLALTADVTLEWPTEQAMPDANVFADIMDVTPDAGGHSIILPDARLASPGQSTLVNNLGGFSFSVKDAGGNVVGSVPSGEVWQFYLSDNTTEDGVWTTFQFGTGSSSATAAALAGAGLKAITTTLNQKHTPRSSAASPLVIVDGDRAAIVQWTGGVGAGTLPDPAVVGTDWFVFVRNNGSGTWTITPTAGLINGQPSLALSAFSSAILYTDGANYFTIGLSQVTPTNFDYTTINVAGSGTKVLAGTELNRIAYKLTGVLTGDKTVQVPNDVQQYWIDNSTTGAFSLTVKTAGGTGIVVTQGQHRILYSNGVDMVDAVTITDPTPIANGGTGATTAGAARTNLGVTLSAVSVTKSADQSYINNTQTTVTFDTETLDAGGWHDNVTNNSRLTVPAGITFARFWSTVTFLLDVTGDPYTSVIAAITKNGSSGATKQGALAPKVFSSPGQGFCELVVDTGWIAVTPGDFYEIKVQTVSTGGVGSSVRGGAAATTFMAEGRAS